jgi:hypothetical protein
MSQRENHSTMIAPSTRFRSRLQRPRTRARRARFLPRLDQMENRTLLSTWTVTNNFDSGPGSLRYDIGHAAAGDSIKFSAALDGQTISLTGGELTLAQALNIDGPGAGKLTVSGGGVSRVFAISSGADVMLSGLTIADGSAAQGGGIDNFGTLAIDQCALVSNTASGGSGDSTTPDAASGGGIANEVGASLGLRDSSIVGNVAAARPGDDSFGGALLNLGSAVVTDCTFTGNQATGGASSSFFDASSGGAIESFGLPPDQLYDSTLSISGSTFIANQAIAASTGASEGGAIDLQFGVLATITNSSFTGNVVTGGSPESPFADGGAAINNEGCTLTLSTSTFNDNQAVGPTGVEGVGGAVSLDSAGTIVNIAKCAFTNNLSQGGTGQGSSGGAIENYAGTVTVFDSTLTDNQAKGGAATGETPAYDNTAFGGGISNLADGSLTITNSTLTGNQAVGGSGNAAASGSPNGFALGGGIENEGMLTLCDSTLAGNQALGAAGMKGGDGLGGGLDDSFDATAISIDTSYADNLAHGGSGGGDGSGGAIAVGIGDIFGFADSSSLELCGGTLIGNVAKGGAGGPGSSGGNGFGGGAFVGTGGSADFAGAIIVLNVATGGPSGAGGIDGQGIGGGLYLATGAGVTVKKSLVVGNTASTLSNNIDGAVTST